MQEKQQSKCNQTTLTLQRQTCLSTSSKMENDSFYIYASLNILYLPQQQTPQDCLNDIINLYNWEKQKEL